MELKQDYKEQILTFLKHKLRLSVVPQIKETNNKITAYIDIPDDNQYGIVFSRLEKNDYIELLDDNQFVTEQGSSIVYTSKEKPYYVLTLMADYLNEKYSLNVSLNKE